MWRLLEAHGFDVEVYDSPQQFLDVLPVTDASVLIVDVQLGGSCGLAFARHLTDSGVALPVIFMTASHDAEIKRQALKAGCVAFFNKPVPAKDLIQAVIGALSPN